MKKSITFFLVVMLIVSLALMGCSQKAAPADKDSGEPAPSGGIVDINVGTGGTGGVHYVMGTAIANIINQKLSDQIRATPQPAANQVQTARLVDSGELTLGFVDAATVDYALKGEQDFKDAPLNNIRTFLCAHKIGMALTVRAESDIQSLKDFKGKKIAVSSMGTMLPTMEALKKIGIQPEDYTMVFLPFAQQAEALKSKTADIAYQSAWPRSSALIDLAESIEVRFIDYGEELTAEMIKTNPLWAPQPIPAGTYKGQTEDYPGVPGQWLLEIINKDVPEDMAYTMVKTVLESGDILSQAHAAGSQYSLDQIKEFIANDWISAPFHPGVVKYLKEKGIDVPENLIGK